MNGNVRENYGDFFNPANGGQVSFPNFTSFGGGPFVFIKNSSLIVTGSAGAPNAFGVWQIQAPGSAQIHRVDVDNAFFQNPTIKPAFFYATVGPSAPGFTSAWTNNGRNGASLGALPFLFAGTFGPSSFVFCAGHVNGATDDVSPGFCRPDAGTSSNFFQMGVFTQTTWSNGFYGARIDGASVNFVDPAPPTNVAISGLPAGWVQTPPASIVVSASQGGLGIGAFSLLAADGTTLSSKDLGCYFDASNPIDRRGATSTGLSPCPSSAVSPAFDLSSVTFPEGINPIRGNAQSIVGANAQSAAGNLKIDRTPPEVALSGTLPSRFASSVTDAKTLHVDAADHTASVATSGTTDITVKVDSTVVAQSTGACPAGDCARSLDHAFVPANYPVGPHSVTVSATDAAGNVATETHELKIVRPRVGGSPGAVDLFGAQLSTRIEGASANDRFGASVAEVGDLNSDGIADFVVGAPGASPGGRLGAGAAYVIYGAAGPRTLDISTLTASLGFRITGAGALDAAGTAVAGVGDVNDDGLPDIAVGAPRDAVGGLQLLRGSVYVIFGQSGTPADVDLSSLGTRGFRIDGPLLSLLPGQKHFGSFIASPGDTDKSDVNGDGKSDILLGDPSQSHDLLRLLSGSAYLVFGKSDTATVDVGALGTGGRRIDGPTSSAALGTSLAFVDDQNEDDLPDIAIGAPGADLAGRTAAGSAYVVYGSAATDPLDLSSLASNGYTVRGATGQRIGGSLALLGDQNNDSYPEIGIGGNTAAVLRGAPDRAGSTIDLANPFPGYRILHPSSLPATGTLAVASAPDIDGDIIDDFVVLDPAAPPRYWTIYGRPLDQNVDLSALDASDGFPTGAANAPAIAAVTATDAATTPDDDGSLAGIPQASPLGRSNAGEAYVVVGPQRPTCLDYLASRPTQGVYYVTCDDFGNACLQQQNTPTGLASPASVPPQLAQPRAAAATPASDFPADGSFPTYRTPLPGFLMCEKVNSGKCNADFTNTLRQLDVPSGKVEYITKIHFKASMLLNGSRVELRMSAKGVDRKAPIIQALAVRCRIDRTLASDHTCLEGPEFYQHADLEDDTRLHVFNNRTFYAQSPQRLTNPAQRRTRVIKSFYPDNTAKRFYEFAFLDEVRGRSNFDPFDAPLFRAFLPFSPQSARFRCQLRASTGTVVCLFL